MKNLNSGFKGEWWVLGVRLYANRYFTFGSVWHKKRRARNGLCHAESA